MNVQPSQVVFVSGGTEANNLFIKGAAAYLKPTQIAVSAIEHPCVAKPAQELARAGLEAAQARGRRATGGSIWPMSTRRLREPTGLVSVMLANNETGVIQQVAEIAANGAREARLDAYRRGAGAGQDRRWISRRSTCMR